MSTKQKTTAHPPSAMEQSLSSGSASAGPSTQEVTCGRSKTPGRTDRKAPAAELNRGRSKTPALTDVEVTPKKRGRSQSRTPGRGEHGRVLPPVMSADRLAFWTEGNAGHVLYDRCRACMKGDKICTKSFAWSMCHPCEVAKCSCSLAADHKDFWNEVGIPLVQAANGQITAGK